MPRIKDYWIFQERRRSIPWALHVYCTKDYRRYRCDYELFAEWIGNDSMRMEARDIPIRKGDYDSFIKSIELIMKGFNESLSIEDKMQIEKELDFMLENF